MKQAMINYMKQDKFDDIYTPKYAITPLLKYIPRNLTIWECCDYGDSEITKEFINHECKVITSGEEENFFEYKPKEHFDIIITNPPYSLKDEFIKKCYEWNKPFCLLLPITALEGVSRGEMYREFGIEVLVLDRRVNFIENMQQDYKKKSGNWFNTSWFCHNVLPKQLIFEKLNKED